MHTPSEATSGFTALGVAPELVAALTKLRITDPTPIQKSSIPVALEGNDVVGIAQTGTGKTLAFGLPMIQSLGVHKGRGLILLPTRELAIQVEETYQKLSARLGLRTAILIGGASMSRQKDMLKNKPHVIVATPGRLIDHMEQKTISLAEVKVLVLDEADRMLDMGFAPQLNKILNAVPKERQTMLFSATMPAAIMKMAEKHMKSPTRVEVAPAGTASERVTQEIYVLHKDQKTPLLEKLLAEEKGTVLVFSRTKHGAKKLNRQVASMGHTSTELHSNRSLAQRREALEGFKRGKYRVLIATDIAARGIDVTGIALVINYDLPDQAEDYVHRIGRTGRAGREGHAVSFATPDERRDVKDIERILRKVLKETMVPKDLPAVRPMPSGMHDRDDRRPTGRSTHGQNRNYQAGRSFASRRPPAPRTDGRPSHARRDGPSTVSRSSSGDRPAHARPVGQGAGSAFSSRPAHARPVQASANGRPAHARPQGGAGGRKGGPPPRGKGKGGPRGKSFRRNEEPIKPSVTPKSYFEEKSHRGEPMGM